VDFSLEKFNLGSPIAHKLGLSVVAILISYLLFIWLRKLINHKIKDYKKRHQIRRSLQYIMVLVAIILLSFIWVDNLRSVTNFFGFLSAGLALALHQVLLSIAGWVLIILRKPFDLGDRIELNDVRGDVIDIKVFYTTVVEVGNWVEADQSTGRIVNIPNSFIFNESLFNYTSGFGYLWNEIRFLITFDSDWEQAKELVLAIAKEYSNDIQSEARRELDKMSKDYMIKYNNLTPITYVNIVDSGVQITLRYLTSARGRRQTEHRINEQILIAFQREENINLAYPSKTVYRHDADA
jgi:small-conductance mechanosensitive channel